MTTAASSPPLRRAASGSYKGGGAGWLFSHARKTVWLPTQGTIWIPGAREAKRLWPSGETKMAESSASAMMCLVATSPRLSAKGTATNPPQNKPMRTSTLAAVFGAEIPTRAPGATPSVTRLSATRLAAARRPRYVIQCHVPYGYPKEAFKSNQTTPSPTPTPTLALHQH